MCCTVAATAFRKFLHHRIGMGTAVTGRTGWYGFVFISMAISAGKIVVFCGILFKKGRGFLVTRPAVMRRGVLAIRNGKRHMNRMAGEASLKFHIFCMLFMTLHTIRDLSVCFMALAASHIRMGTGVLFHLITLLLVTGKARPGNIAFEL
ncbi:MAG: hypothetical protein DRH17_11505 [Deltaproteobacteria bacterium]|nr:MAG: hypothetical protein DRH17_11505 [Deltaproteobacteria bacterium]